MASSTTLKLELAMTDGTSRTLTVQDPDMTVELSDVQSFIDKSKTNQVFLYDSKDLSGLKRAYIESVTQTDIV